MDAQLLGVVNLVHMTDEVENLVGVADLVVYSWVPGVAQKMLEISKLFNDKSHSFVNLITPTKRNRKFHFLVVYSIKSIAHICSNVKILSFIYNQFSAIFGRGGETFPSQVICKE